MISGGVDTEHNGSDDLMIPPERSGSWSMVMEWKSRTRRCADEGLLHTRNGYSRASADVSASGAISRNTWIHVDFVLKQSNNSLHIPDDPNRQSQGEITGGHGLPCLSRAHRRLVRFI